jgi:hypothetical protein
MQISIDIACMLFHTGRVMENLYCRALALLDRGVWGVVAKNGHLIRKGTTATDLLKDGQIEPNQVAKNMARGDCLTLLKAAGISLWDGGFFHTTGSLRRLAIEAINRLIQQ